MGFSLNLYQPLNFVSGYSKKSKKLVVFVALIVLGIFLLAGYAWAHRDITIYDNNKTYHVKIIGGNVEKAIKKSKLGLRKEDLVEPGLKVDLKQGMKIKITRAFSVKLAVDAKTMDIMTPYNSVDQILKKNKIKLGELDRVEPGKDAKVTKGTVIKVTRVVVKTETNQEELAFKIEKRDDNNTEKGKTTVLQQGQKGVASVTTRIVYEDGQEVKREVIEKKVLQKPVNSIVAVGTINYMIASRGETIKYSKSIRMFATWYTHTGRNTASGIYPYKGVVSVDPSVIPLGTKLYIQGYGYAIALDKGGGIKGNRIDLFFDTSGGWRNQYVDVYILQ